jgi:hypothetical protein
VGGQEAALWHRSALEAHGLTARFDAIDVSSTHRRAAPSGVRHHHVRHSPASHVEQVQGVAVTTMERTLVDMAVSPRRPGHLAGRGLTLPFSTPKSSILLVIPCSARFTVTSRGERALRPVNPHRKDH